MSHRASAEPARAQLDAWLQSLLGLFSPLRPTAMALLASTEARPTIEWLDQAPGEQLVLRARVPADVDASGGWLVPLVARDACFFSILLTTATPLRADGAELGLVATASKSSFALLWPGQGLPRSAASECLHELRNALNSVLMSAAVVAGPKLPDELRIYAVDLEQAARRSLQAMTELSLLLRE